MAWAEGVYDIHNRVMSTGMVWVERCERQQFGLASVTQHAATADPRSAPVETIRQETPHRGLKRQQSLLGRVVWRGSGLLGVVFPIHPPFWLPWLGIRINKNPILNLNAARPSIQRSNVISIKCIFIANRLEAEHHGGDHGQDDHGDPGEGFHVGQRRHPAKFDKARDRASVVNGSNSGWCD